VLISATAISDYKVSGAYYSHDAVNASDKERLLSSCKRSSNHEAILYINDIQSIGWDDTRKRRLQSLKLLIRCSSIRCPEIEKELERLLAEDKEEQAPKHFGNRSLVTSAF